MKRILTIVTLTALGATAPLLHATPDLSTARPGQTPYDQYMRPVSTVLHRLNGRSPSFDQVAAYVRQGFAFRYVYDAPYVATMPDVTEAKRAGDCKAKSLWLAWQMNDPNVRYVIGKARRTSRISHAWLMWKHNRNWWILDPTNSPNPILASNVGPDDYLITYSYDQRGSYCHTQPPQKRRSVAGRAHRR